MKKNQIKTMVIDEAQLQCSKNMTALFACRINNGLTSPIFGIQYIIFIKASPASESTEYCKIQCILVKPFLVLDKETSYLII